MARRSGARSRSASTITVFVKSLTSYGAFVDIGGIDGMVHVSELSWSRIKQPSDVLSVGDEVDVYVISFDPENHKISLGYKDPNGNPWNKFMSTFQVAMWRRSPSSSSCLSARSPRCCPVWTA